MLTDRNAQAEWLEFSGLPAKLNEVRQGGWLIFKKLVELDCRAHRCPGTVEITLGELAERCGLPVETVSKIIEALRRKHFLRCFLPDNAEEPGLFEIRVPIATPLDPIDVAARVTDPLLRDVGSYRYLSEPADEAVDEAKVQAIVDLYLNLLSHKMNVFILEQIELAARRFELEEIRLTMERAARHNLRSIGWVLKELIRDHKKHAGEISKPGTDINNRI